MNILNLNIKGSISIIPLINVLSIISSSKLIFIFLLSLSNKLSTKLKTFFAYRFEAETGNLFKILLSLFSLHFQQFYPPL